MPRVLIADDHPLFRVALKDTMAYIEEDFSITEASTFSEVEALAVYVKKLGSYPKAVL